MNESRLATLLEALCDIIDVKLGQCEADFLKSAVTAPVFGWILLLQNVICDLQQENLVHSDLARRLPTIIETTWKALDVVLPILRTTAPGKCPLFYFQTSFGLKEVHRNRRRRT